jgi:hypothetical protein
MIEQFKYKGTLFLYNLLGYKEKINKCVEQEKGDIYDSLHIKFVSSDSKRKTARKYNIILLGCHSVCDIFLIIQNT